MKKVILSLVMLLFAVCVNGQVSNKEAARMLCESVPLKKYDKKVCQEITVRINVSKVDNESQREVFKFFREKGINCNFQIGRPQLENEKEYAVMIFGNTNIDYKLGVTELDFTDLMGCFNIIYKDTKEYKEHIAKVEKMYSSRKSSRRDSFDDYRARQNYYGAMYRLTGNIGFLTNY